MSYTAGQKLRASQMSVYACTSTTRPTGHTGQLIYESDTGGLVMYDGSQWLYMGSTGAVNTSYRGHQSSGQAITTSTNTLVSIDTDDVTSALVTKATLGAGHKFTLNRAGMWMVTAAVRWPTASSGELSSQLQVNGVTTYGQGGPSSSIALTHTVAMVQHFIVNDNVTINVFQSSGSSKTLDTTVSGVKIALAWLHS